MRVLVCGSRDALSPKQTYDALDALLERPTLIINGGADGVDRYARDWATEYEIAYLTVPAKWLTYGKPAGPRRNAAMLEWKPDLVLALPGGIGTSNMVKQAHAAGVPVVEIKA